MLRRLFNILSAVSLVLFAFSTLAIALHPNQGYFASWIFGPERRYTAQWMLAYRAPAPLFNRFGFWLSRTISVTESGNVRDAWGLSISYWVLAVVWAIIPAVRLRQLIHDFPNQRARKRSSRGLCPVCSYNLLATPDRCPECGTVPNSKPVPPKNPVISN
jgi:hypothetical protein